MAGGVVEEVSFCRPCKVSSLEPLTRFVIGTGLTLIVLTFYT